MRHTIPLLVLLLLLLAPALGAQANFVKNGDFSAVDPQGMPLVWKVTSLSFHNANVADFVFNGVTYFQKSFNCAPGGSSAYSRPYPLVILEQDVVLPANTPIEFFADIGHSRQAAVTNVDRGQFKVYLGSQLMTTVPSGRQNLVGPDALTETIHFRTPLTTGGPMKLKITMERYYYATDVICHIDNVFLGPTPPAAFSIAGDRAIGKSFSYRLLGDPMASAYVFMATGPSKIPGGIPVPGFSGTFNLDFTLFFQLWSATLDNTGTYTGSGGTFPNDTALVGVPIWFQALQVTKTPTFSFGVARPFAWFP